MSGPEALEIAGTALIIIAWVVWARWNWKRR
jgi:hypothetical protein